MRLLGLSVVRQPILAMQLAIAAAALAIIALAPPARGPMLLVPVTPAAATELAALAVASGSRLIAQGPLPGSLIVDGDALAGALIGHGILTLAAPRSGCGEKA
ncbi:hypothetical protein SAMN06295912_10941 [Sphingomonas laterariae]|uniref:Uncharacterized protein n=1 Tax=Edaphosphingomonas laterariae TaxID=861865 RepID=A0A239FJ18_9SPHN|nr:hypothetical protein [Sphingomonas laterariae]SNS56202.1 hypothetical protein SAMN06295912_10941 [Sphingomonas laterariae]